MHAPDRFPRRRAGLILGLTLFLGLTLSTASVQAHDAHLGKLHITHPAAPATLPGQTSGAVYLGIENEGKEADRLLSATTPAAASVAIHRMALTGNNIMRMREIDSLPLPAGGKVVVNADSGLHLMLTGLKQPLVVGDKVPLTLRFEHAGTVEVSIHVEPNAAQAGRTDEHGMAAGHAH